MKQALAILTYVPLNARESLRQRLPTAMASLNDTNYPGSVAIVDDASTDPQHVSYLESLPSRIRVIRRERNGGISCAKNTCIRSLMELGVDVAFLAEDDVQFRVGWWETYLDAHAMTGIQHFSWASDVYHRNMRKTQQTVNGFNIVRTSRLNGTFLTFTPEVVKRVGGFKVLPAKWGHEHINWTNRIVRAGLAPFYCDVVDSNNVINFNRYSGTSSVSRADKRRFTHVNQQGADDLSQVWLPLEEEV